MISFAGPGKAREKHHRRFGRIWVLHHSLPTECRKTPYEAFRFVTDNVAGFLAARWMLREQAGFTRGWFGRVHEYSSNSRSSVTGNSIYLC